MITRVRAAFVIGHDGSDHTILPQAELVHDDERVVFVGRGYPGPVDVEIDAGLSIVSPGFVDLNALADIDHALFDSWHGPDTRSGLLWSERRLRRGTGDFTAEELSFRRRFAVAQLALNGVTTMMPIAAENYHAWCEDGEDARDLADAVERIGLRAYLGPSYRAAVPYTRGDGVLFHEDEAAGERGLDEAAEFAAQIDARGHGLLRGALLPARIETQTEALLRRTRRVADELGLPVRLHAAQGLAEMEIIQARSGLRSLPYLERLGFLGELTFIPHAWTVPGHPLVPAGFGGGDDVALLASHGTTVILCPLPTAHYGGTLHDFDAYRAAGVRVTLGTDSAPPNMIKAMDLAMAMSKTQTGDRASAQAADLFRAATSDGADALGRPDLGRLRPGAQADYIVIDLAGTHVGPHADPIRTLVMNTDGRDITRVVVAGRTIVDGGRVVTVDTATYAASAQAFMERYLDAMAEADVAQRGRERLFPSSFPVG